MSKLIKLKENLIRGDTPIWSFPMTVSGAVTDLTGYVVTLTITDQSNPLTTDTPIIKISVTGDTTGIANFQLLNDQTNNATRNLVPGTVYYWDVQLFNSLTGTLKRVLTVVRGTVGVDADFNRTES